MIDDPNELTPEENAYFENRGNVDGQTEDQAPEAPEVEAEVEAEVAEQPVKEPQAPRLVPFEALQEERRERQALARQAQEREQQFVKLQSRLDTLQEVFQPKVEPPKYEEDPLGAINHQLAETTKNYETLKQAEAARAQDAQTQRHIAELQAFGRKQADEYAKTAPDFYDAYSAMQSLKEAELRAMGYTDEAQIKGWVLEYEFNMIQKAASEGANVAERLYTMAKALGYTPKQAANAEKKLESIAAGQQASKSLGSAGGSAPAPKITLAALDKMSDEEFARATSDPEVWRRLNLGA